jgi:lysophospholipase L1-like esterase
VNANTRWPNDLARRLDARKGITLSVVDEGISGNRVLNDSICCGVNALARFDRDVVDQAGAREVILLEGINDIGFSQLTSAVTAPHTDVSAQEIIAGYEQIIAQAHAAGLKIFGGTLTPFKGAAYWTPAGEVKREQVNTWIRTSGASTASLTSTLRSATPLTRSCSTPPTTAEITCTPPTPATRPWQTPSTWPCSCTNPSSRDRYQTKRGQDTG